MKRHDPYKRGNTEQRLDNNRHYEAYIRDDKKGVGKVNPIFLKDHYGVKKEASK